MRIKRYALVPLVVTIATIAIVLATGAAAAPPAVSAAPVVSTKSATSVGQAGATLNGTVNPSGQTTSYYFEYGTTTAYGYETAPVNAGAGTASLSASASVGGLASSTVYHFRVVAVSAGGTALGNDQTFTTTTPPVVSTGAPSDVTDSSLTLNGVVTPQGRSTSFYFQFGTTASYGLQTPPAGAGSGTGGVAVHVDITGLVSSTIYHYRLVAQSSGGISYGADRTVKTAGPAVIPSRTAVLGRMGFVSPGGTIGVVIGCFGGQTSCVGHITLSHNGTIVGQRNFTVGASNGGFQNMQLSAGGRKLLRSPSLLQVTVTVTTTSGQKTSQVMHLARWH